MAGQTLTETFTVVSQDGTASNTVTVTINGTNDGPTIDLDSDNSSTATGNDYVTSFTEGGSAVAIADMDVSITDIDNATIQSATITLTNAEVDDLLTVGSLPAGISASAYDPGNWGCNIDRFSVTHRLPIGN